MRILLWIQSKHHLAKFKSCLATAFTAKDINIFDKTITKYNI